MFNFRCQIVEHIKYNIVTRIAAIWRRTITIIRMVCPVECLGLPEPRRLLHREQKWSYSLKPGRQSSRRATSGPQQIQTAMKVPEQV